MPQLSGNEPILGLNILDQSLPHQLKQYVQEISLL
jgi:hypothetical protein